MNRDEVRKLARELGIKNVSSYTKAQLEDMIEDTQNARSDGPVTVNSFKNVGYTAEGGEVFTAPVGTPEPRFDRDDPPAQRNTAMTYPETFPVNPNDRPGRGMFGKDPARVAAERARRYSRS